MNNTITSMKNLIGAVAALVRRTCLWFAGMPADELMHHRMDTQMRYTSAGFVVAVWYALMCVVWGKTGAQLFGAGGALAFLLFPTLMLALDRMILSHPRNPAGVLSAYNIPGVGAGRTQMVARGMCAIAFSLATTGLFLVQQNQSDIHAQQKKDHLLQNEPIRKEALARIEVKAKFLNDSKGERIVALNATRSQANADYEKARAVADDSETRLRGAQFNAVAEVGGIEGRKAGAGLRFRTYSALAQQSKDDAVNARSREARAKEQLSKVDEELKGIKTSSEKVLNDYNSAVAGVDEEVQLDPRFVARKNGLFADATTLIGLYGDEQVGPGLSAATLITVLVLFVSELAPLIACSILPITAFDVERIARDRADAAMSVAQHELHVVNAQARRTVSVRDITGEDERNRAANPGGAIDPSRQHGLNNL